MLCARRNGVDPVLTGGSWCQLKPRHRSTPKPPTTRTTRRVALHDRGVEHAGQDHEVTLGAGGTVEHHPLVRAVGVPQQPAREPVGETASRRERADRRDPGEVELRPRRPGRRVGQGVEDGAAARGAPLVDRGAEGMVDLRHQHLVERIGTLEVRPLSSSSSASRRNRPAGASGIPTDTTADAAPGRSVGSAPRRVRKRGMRSLRGRPAVLVLAVVMATTPEWRAPRRRLQRPRDPRINRSRMSREAARSRVRASGPGRLPERSSVREDVTIDRNKLSPSDKEDIERAQLQLRSIGLLGDDVDLIDALTSLQTSARWRVRPGDQARDRPRQEARRRQEGQRARAHVRVAGSALQPDQAPTCSRPQPLVGRAQGAGGGTRCACAAVRGRPAGRGAQRVQQSQVAGSNGTLADLARKGVPDSLSVLFRSVHPRPVDARRRASGQGREGDRRPVP